MSEDAPSLHPDPETIQLYVMGALDGARAQRIEAHIVDCERCAALLEQESSLELSLKQVAENPTPSPPRRVGSFAVAVVAFVTGALVMAVIGAVAIALLWA